MVFVFEAVAINVMPSISKTSRHNGRLV
jgi:hypothetical protein